MLLPNNPIPLGVLDAKSDARVLAFHTGLEIRPDFDGTRHAPPRISPREAAAEIHFDMVAALQTGLV